MKALPLLLAALVVAATAFAQAPAKPPASPKPDPAKPEAAKPEAAKPDPAKSADASPATDTWIFSGVLADGHESYSGTLVATKDQSEFEMRFSSGGTCSGGQLKGEVGLVRLPEITCSDDRKLRALFVPQGGSELKVFGHIGDQRFAASAHLLGTDAPPEPKQTAQPKGPLGLPPRMPPGGPGPGAPPPSPIK